MGSPEVQRQLVLGVVASGNLVAAQQAGIVLDWFDDMQAAKAWSAIVEYAQDPRTPGKVPGVSYLTERQAMVPGMWTGTESVEQVVEAMRLDRFRALNGSALATALSRNQTDPVGAHAGLLKALTSRDIEVLSSCGREVTLAEIAPSLYQDYVASVDVHGIVGVHCAFEAMTHATKGWVPGNFYCFYGPEKSYKTWTLLENLRVAHHTDTRNVLLVTSEMPPEELGVRLLCLIHGWNYEHYRDRRLRLSQVKSMLSAVGYDRIHFLHLTSFDLQAIAEVRAKIQRLNMQGGVSVVFWDGHYRSASTPDWKEIYALVQGTRALALEPEIGRPPIVATAQEGSQKGQVSHRAYRREASLMCYGTKVGYGKLLLQSTASRAARDFEIQVSVDLTTSTLTQTSSRTEGDLEGLGTGSVV